jgi:hypothetical protein
MRMAPQVYNFPHKRQTKANDCWYACTQMLLSWRAGQKAKPQGVAVTNHRDVWAFGRTLSFGSNTGQQVMRDNGLVNVGHRLELGDIQSVKAVLDDNGPFIIGGHYGPCGAGHFVVICGCDTATDMVYRDNPAWGYDKAWKSINYLNKAWKDSAGHIDVDSAVALRPVRA